MHAALIAAPAAGRGFGRGRIRRLRELAEPGLHGGEQAHEAAGAHEAAARTSARRQVGVELLLVDFVHVQQAIRRALVERGVLDVLAQHAGAFLVAAPEQAAAFVMVMRMLG